MRITVIYLFVLLIAVSCNSGTTNRETKNKEQNTFEILVSKDPDMHFKKWLSNYSGGDSIVLINMYSVKSSDSVKKWLEKAEGIIISGGEDVNPALYNKAGDSTRCGTIDKHRDSLELRLIEFALSDDIPLLAVCRGHQILNVSQGGSLIVDIPEDYGSPTMHRDNGATQHIIKTESNSFLYSIIQSDSTQKLYSNHHQAIDRLGEGLSIGGYAPDGIPESIELADKSRHPFVLGIQWHPEAMSPEVPSSVKIGTRFLSEVKAVKERKQNSN
ncbi:MAG: gamma-glutamyl-gamma-aminobutyrate hydrolase family protein [Bacteroidota bacterium]|nr:gamma-glutamyl-gamma-aminobutyrate hydrolase family protein [Bacteroidota bacterium]